MEPFEEDELTGSELNDAELKAMLRTWESPAAPQRIRQAVFPARAASWRRGIWTSYIRVPLPVAMGLVALMAFFVWWRTRPVTVYRDRVTPVTVYRDRPTPVTVYRDRPTPVIIYRDRLLPSPTSVPADAGELHPVTALQPRIVRNSDAQN